MDTAELAGAIIARDRRALARAITLIESRRADHRAQASDLLSRLAQAAPPDQQPAQHAGQHPARRPTLRLGLSGTPGVGKSSFIEAFGLQLTAAGLTVAVLAVDPSSSRSGGSILGDKTRMELLSRDPRAFIRPSPSQTHLGGVARRTREVVALCEAAGFDLVLIETVGVGQSETLVAEMTDIFVLLMAPAGGDELQGVKRGIMERADLILVNKADGDLARQASATCSDYAGALRLLRHRPQDPPGWPRAMTVSALTGTGLSDAWAAIQELADWRRAQGILARTRSTQDRDAFRTELLAEIMARLASNPALAARMASVEADLAQGRLTPTAAAERLLAPLFAGLQTGPGAGP